MRVPDCKGDTYHNKDFLDGHRSLQSKERTVKFVDILFNEFEDLSSPISEHLSHSLPLIPI